MDDFTSSLLCHENETCFEGEQEGDEEYDSFIIESEEKNYDGVSEDEEHVDILIEREIRFGFKKDETLVFGDWMKRARLDAINWILKTRATLGFRFQTAYLSVTYFDRFLSKRSIDSEKDWASQLLSVACLTLAAKMEECKVPSLSEFPFGDLSFESKVIQKMELLVLGTLEWNLSIITTPFALLPYFITKLCKDSQPSPIFSKAMQLTFTLMKEINLMDHRPSVIAVAATLVALDQQLTMEAVELKICSIPQHRFLESKDVFACYNQIRRLSIEKTREKVLHTPNPSPIRSKPTDTTESSVVSFAAITKRRRLTFDDDEGNSDRKGLH